MEEVCRGKAVGEKGAGGSGTVCGMWPTRPRQGRGGYRYCPGRLAAHRKTLSVRPGSASGERQHIAPAEADAGPGVFTVWGMGQG